MIGEELTDFVEELETCIVLAQLQRNKRLTGKLVQLKRAFAAFSEEDWELLAQFDDIEKD